MNGRSLRWPAAAGTQQAQPDGCEQAHDTCAHGNPTCVMAARCMEPSGFFTILTGLISTAEEGRLHREQLANRHGWVCGAAHLLCCHQKQWQWQSTEASMGRNPAATGRSDGSPPVLAVWPFRKSGSASFRSISNSSSTCSDLKGKSRRSWDLIAA